MSRTFTLNLTKIVSGVKQPDTGRTVTLRDLDASILGTASESPANSGQYSVTITEVSKYAYWYVDGVQKAGYSNNSPFWVGVYDSVSGSTLSARGSASPQILAQGTTQGLIDIKGAAGSPASMKFWNGTNFWQFGHTAVAGKYQFNYNNVAKFQMDSDGKMGINKTSPTSELDVNGSVSATLIYTKVVTLTDQENIATDASQGNHFKVTLGGNRTLDDPTNGVDGQKILWEIKQDATGNRTLAFGGTFDFGTTITEFTPSTAANKTDFIGAIYSAADDKWHIIAVSKGY